MTQTLIKETPEFHMIWTKTGRQPRKKHGNYAAAEKEAVRLAKANPGKKFIVLTAVAKISATAPEHTKSCGCVGCDLDLPLVSGRSPNDLIHKGFPADFPCTRTVG